MLHGVPTRWSDEEVLTVRPSGRGILHPRSRRSRSLPVLRRKKECRLRRSAAARASRRLLPVALPAHGTERQGAADDDPVAAAGTAALHPFCCSVGHSLLGSIAAHDVSARSTRDAGQSAPQADGDWARGAPLHLPIHVVNPTENPTGEWLTSFRRLPVGIPVCCPTAPHPHSSLSQLLVVPAPLSEHRWPLLLRCQYHDNSTSHTMWHASSRTHTGSG
jgi:hypothetical protein